MNSDQRLVATWVAISGTFYVIGCFVAGITLDRHLAWKFALLTMGLNYLAYSVQLADLSPTLGGFLVLMTVVTGVCAGAFLLGA